MLRLEDAAWAHVLERIEASLASTHDVRGTADLLLDALASALEVPALELFLPAPTSGRPESSGSRGEPAGMAIDRALRHAERDIGALRIWGIDDPTVETLDALLPWIAVALGTSLTIAEERRARVGSEAECSALEDALVGVLATHQGPAYVLDNEGQAHAGNDAATRALAADGARTLEKLAHAVGEGRREEFDILPVKIAGRTDRIVVLERRSLRSFEERVADAAEKWALTPRQREVLACVARGMSNKEIAAELECAEVTVENHLTQMYRRAGVDGRQRLVAVLTAGGPP